MSKQSAVSLRRRRQMMCLYSGFLFLCALAIALMPIGSTMKDKSMLMMYFSGAGFWIGLLGTIFMALRINHCRKANHRFSEVLGNRKQLGLFHFFQNTEAMIMDSVMILSVITLIIAKFLNADLQIIYAIIAVFIFSFGMHCMLNGMNYIYINYSKFVKERKKNE